MRELPMLRAAVWGMVDLANPEVAVAVFDEWVHAYTLHRSPSNMILKREHAVLYADSRDYQNILKEAWDRYNGDQEEGCADHLERVGEASA